MAFNELGFLFIFFPGALLLYAVLPAKAKNVLLLPVSLVFFAWGCPEYLVLLVLSILFNYFSGLQIAAQKAENQKIAKLVLISAVAVNLLLLGFFKYWGFVLENINALLRTSIPVRALPLPLGISFFTFSALSYLFDVYRDKEPAAKNILHFALYISFFPKLVSGPIVTYSTFVQQLGENKRSAVKFCGGCRLFLIGLAKKVLLSDIIGATFTAVTALPVEGISVATAWLGAISYTLMLYFDFSGYSDMAIGLSQMFGFSFEKNFNYPYLASSLTDFWRRWHISLGAWFRDYVYIPLGGSREGTLRTIRNLLIVWLLTGIWHGASWSFVIWGLYHGALLLLEKFLLKPVLDKVPCPAKVPFTLFAVIIGWVFFSPTLSGAFAWLGKMFGAGGAVFMDATARYYLSTGAMILIIGAFAAFPIGARLGAAVYRSGKLTAVLSLVWFVLLLILCIAGMTSSTYSSFLYFQF